MSRHTCWNVMKIINPQWYRVHSCSVFSHGFVSLWPGHVGMQHCSIIVLTHFQTIFIFLVNWLLLLFACRKAGRESTVCFWVPVGFVTRFSISIFTFWKFYALCTRLSVTIICICVPFFFILSYWIHLVLLSVEKNRFVWKNSWTSLF